MIQHDLELLHQFLVEANTTNSTNEKKEILKKYSALKKLFRYTYDNMYQYNVTSKNVEKLQGQLGNVEYSYNCIYLLLDDLRNRKITGHTAIASVQDFISKYSEYKDEIYRIIDKDLKVRIDTKLINTIFPNTIPVFEVALANKYDSNDKKIKIDDGTWFCSQKCDGARTVCIIEHSNITFLSRAGKEFLTLDVLKNEIEKLNYDNIVLDGEICLKTENDEDDFQGIIKQLKKKDHTIENPHYKIFDILTLDEFYNPSNTSNTFGVFEDRHKRLLTLPTSKSYSILPQTKITSLTQFEQLRTEAREKNWEGLMLRKNIYYESGRSKNLLKVKDMQSDEYIVEDIEIGPFRIINKDTKLEETITTLSSVIIKHKNNVVHVGSGFSLDERKEFYEDRSKIIGKKIEVNYFEETESKGEFSLRFPVYKGIRDYE